MSAFYLKYRPQSLSELVGQEAVKNALNSSFANNKLSHAYLFTGPRGTGKTSTARILAKMVNCLGKESPCNKCSTCVSIADGSNLDLIEIDAASNRGIEDIRTLREKIKLSPTSAKKKVYIIDEAHMLTTEAFNALLKTLEEPPGHALFILATTEASKIPETIGSRTQKLTFNLASEAQLLEALEKIIKAEKIDIDEVALKILVKKAEGSFRDGVKLLDQLASSEEKITAQSLSHALKSGSFENTLEIAVAVKKKNPQEALLVLKKHLDEGAYIKELLLNLMDFFRSLVFIKNGVGDELVKINISGEEYKTLADFSADFANKDLTDDLDILQKAYEKLKTSPIPSLPLELALVEMCNSQKTVIKQDYEVKTQVQQETASEPIPEIKSEIPVAVVSDSPDIAKLKEKWTFVLETIRPYNFSLEALLRSINIAECTPKEVRLMVPYAFHQRILEAPKNRDLLEGVLSDILGRSIQISVVLGSRPQRTEDIANIELAADDEIIRAAAEIFSSDTVN